MTNRIPAALREILKADLIAKLTQADYSDELAIGREVDFSIVQQNASLAEIVADTLKTIASVNLSALIDSGDTFKVVYIAKNAPTDAILSDSTGTHICIPSAVIGVLDKAAQGIFPPELPEAFDEEEEEHVEENTEEGLSFADMMAAVFGKPRDIH